jgi:capsular polysaccharide biosynthesis protein
MSDQALDLKRSLQILRRRWAVVVGAAVVGLGAGVGLATLHPPQLRSSAQVLVAPYGQQTSANGAATQAVVADSSVVLKDARGQIPLDLSIAQLQKVVRVSSPTSAILAISASGRAAAQAEAIANAVANSYVAYANAPGHPAGTVHAQVVTPAATATGKPLLELLLIYGALGALLATVVGAIIALAISRSDRRLRQRDEIADSIGIPVLASVPVEHPTTPAGWVELLTEYQPGPVDAWRLRGALHHLGLGDAKSAGVSQGMGTSLAVYSLGCDPGALALGPQLAVFAASLGIRTRLVIGPQQDSSVTATLRAACTGMAAVKSKWSRFLQVAVVDRDGARDQSHVPLTIVVAVVDEKAPRITGKVRAAATVLGVSAGAATAEDLARVAASAADNGRQITGILVADPDSADHTTGRLPQPTRIASHRQPTHLTGISTETRRWMTQTRRSQ